MQLTSCSTRIRLLTVVGLQSNSFAISTCENLLLILYRLFVIFSHNHRSNWHSSEAKTFIEFSTTEAPPYNYNFLYYFILFLNTIILQIFVMSRPLQNILIKIFSQKISLYDFGRKGLIFIKFSMCFCLQIGTLLVH